MRGFRVAAVTMNGILGKHRENLAGMAVWTARARKAGADLVLFPELIVGGHCDPGTKDRAEAIPGGPAAREILRMAREQKIFVCAGLAERAGAAIYNTQLLAGPEGFAGVQRKIHLSRDEVLHFAPGSELQIFDLGFCKVGISICFDSWSPEVPRLLALAGADVILMPHASRMKMWNDTPRSERAAAECIHGFFRKVYAARAFENACYVVAVNQAGRAGTLDCYPPDHGNQPHHAGGCVVFDPWGELIAELPPNRIAEDMLVADLPAQTLQDARAHPNYTLSTRRPEVYGGLASCGDGETRHPAEDKVASTKYLRKT